MGNKSCHNIVIYRIFTGYISDSDVRSWVILQ